MRRRLVLVFLPTTVVLLSVGFRSSQPPAGPGGKIGAMTLVRGPEEAADDELWRFCQPVLPKGRRHGACFVPRVRRLFIGYGDFERTRMKLDSVWRALKWDLWLDGRRVDLPRFGTSDRTLYDFPPAGSKTVILREWNVILVGGTRGKHVIRYRSASRTLGATEGTWTFTLG